MFLLFTSLLLVACGKSDDDDPVASSSSTMSDQGSEAGDPVTVSGKVRYELVPPFPNCSGLDYASAELRPIRGATVHLIDANSSELIDSDLATESGDYALQSTAQREVFVRVRAELKQVGSPAWDVDVRDNTSNTNTSLGSRPLYVVDSNSFTMGDSDQVRNFTAATGWDGASYSGYRAAAPFAILDTVYEVMLLVLEVDPAAQFAPLDIFWSTNNSTFRAASLNTGINSGAIGTSFYVPQLNSLFLLGMEDDDTEEFDRHVIAHEWGHYFEDNFSRSDSAGGPHSLGQRLDMRLAFSEGWATAFSGMALNNPRFCDTVGSQQRMGFGIHMEYDQFGPSGWFNEISVLSILYDLWDTQVDGADVSSLGFQPLFDVLVNEQAETSAFASVFSFMKALKARNPEQATFIDSLLAQHSINGPGLDAYGSNETNDASAPDVLPIYTDIIPDGTPVTLCANSQFDGGYSGNKLSEYRYLRMLVTNPGSYIFSISTQSPASPLPPPGFDCTDPANAGDPNNFQHSDPDFLLVRRGQVVAAGQSCTANSEVTTADDLPAGDYVISLLEFRYADGNTPPDFPEQSCFEVTVSPGA